MGEVKGKSPFQPEMRGVLESSLRKTYVNIFCRDNEAETKFKKSGLNCHLVGILFFLEG